MVYQALALCLGLDQPLYGLQSVALAHLAREHETLDAMAATYAAAIQQHQPEGPYYLLGWSMGGVLAMAAAEQLERQGQRVAFVGLIDSHLHTHNAPSLTDDPLWRLVLTFGGILAGAVLALDAAQQQALRDELLGLPPTEQWQWLMAWGQERHLLSSALPLDMLQQQTALTEVHIALSRAHNIIPIRAPLYVWWARNSLQEGYPSTDWGQYTSDTVHLEIIEGNHFSVMQEPYVQALAKHVRVSLQMLSNYDTKATQPVKQMEEQARQLVIDVGVQTRNNHDQVL